MRGVSTFGAFTTARLGIYAAQKALDVTGHNITNINTIGYTRQRLDQMSLRTGGSNRYASVYDTQVGSGVLCTGVSQIRDPYLDIRFRNEQSSVGSMDTKLAALEELSKILDEVGKGADEGGLLEARFNDLHNKLSELSKAAGQEDMDTLLRSSSESLVKLLNNYANQLNEIKQNQEEGFQQDIDSVNDILKNIASLNDSIMKSDLHGDPALELRDQRNLLIDELSKYAKITVEYKNTQMGAGKSVEELTIRLAGTPNGSSASQTTLIDGSFARQFSVDDSRTYYKPNPDYDSTLDPTANPDDPKTFPYLDWDGNPTKNWDEAKKDTRTGNYDLSLSPLKNQNGTALAGSGNVSLEDLDLHGSLQASREMLTEAGEYTDADVIKGIPNNDGTTFDFAYDTSAATKRGIPYYQKSLDSLAQKFASVFNDANTGYLSDPAGNYVDKDGKPLVYKDPTDQTAPPFYFTKESVADGLTQDQSDYFYGKPEVPGTPPTPAVPGHSVKLGGALFSNDNSNNNPGGITAANISISKDWSLGNVRVVTSMTMGRDPGVPETTGNENVLRMMALLKDKHDYKADDVSSGSIDGDKAYFRGSFQELLSNTCGTLANDARSTSILLNNYASSMTEISVSRSSISGVDLNDEATNLMQFQKSYSAACRLMTTLDEALDKLINGTGVVGR